MNRDTSRLVLIGLGLMLASASSQAGAPAAGDEGYRILGDLAVMDQGRVKPLDTLAIARVKTIYSRQNINLIDPKTGAKTSWGPVAAMLDWTVRPDFWDDQNIIYVEFLPLKKKLLAGPIKADLNRIASKDSTSAADKSVLESIAALAEPGETDLDKALTLNSIGKDDKAVIQGRLGQLLGEKDHKWISPNDLENAVVDLDGHSIPFEEWFGEIRMKQESASESMGGKSKQPQMEAMADEVGVRLFTYRAIRDHNPQKIPPLDLAVMPRPSSTEYLAYCGAAEMKLRKDRNRDALTALELDSLRLLNNYIERLQADDRATPGTGNAKFDGKLAAWFRDKAEWVPIRVVLQSDLDELKTAGFSIPKVEAFRAAFQAVENAEKAAPNQLPAEKAQALVAAARDLGGTLGPYPSAPALARESHYNHFAPFFRAPVAFGLAVVLLLLCMGITSRADSLIGKLGSACYGIGMLAFVGGIGLVIYGFYLRIRITGWAPVTSMEESVPWVAMVTAGLGLVFELITRKKYAALAGAGIAMITTLLAANVSFLDPQIKALQPVLRSNYWLTIHVLTIVSSYAAFALALGLGLIAIGFYLTATYRRSATFGSLAQPLLAALPMAALGGLGIYGSYAGWLPTTLGTEAGFYVAALVFYAGWIPAVASIYGVIGELANRAPGRAILVGVIPLALGGIGATLGLLHAGPRWLSIFEAQFTSWTVALIGLSWTLLGFFGVVARSTLESARLGLVDQHVELDHEDAEFHSDAMATSGMMASAGAGVGTATLSRPSVAEIRARQDAQRPKLDARGVSMQETAARLKPLANFVYRAMQVGVLLCAAGTILGGVWADYSWGRFWGWDPKEVWALITLLVYLVPLHGRFAGWVNSFGLSVASVICFSSVLMAWYGVNFVLGVGLHSYGFLEGGGQGIVIFSALSVIAVTAGAIWRRRLSMRPEAA